MDQTAFFKLSYGLYIISTTSEERMQAALQIPCIR